MLKLALNVLSLLICVILCSSLLPFNVTYSGTICCVHNGLCSEKELDAYKKEHIPEIMARMAEALGNEEIKTADSGSVSFEEEENVDD